jgi:hypothetical protein
MLPDLMGRSEAVSERLWLVASNLREGSAKGKTATALAWHQKPDYQGSICRSAVINKVLGLFGLDSGAENPWGDFA